MTSVLVVDGRPADREVLATVLGHAGYTVAEAATGELAIELAHSQRPDLIITHILTPDMDGYEPVNDQRSEHVTADIRVIYSKASAGERGRFMFTSYGHTYSVDAIPVQGDDGGIDAVLAIATPARSFAYAATACESTAERLDRSATNAEQRAERHRVAGRGDAEVTERTAAARARRAAERARANAQRLSLREGAAAPAEPPSLTPRETEVLSLASHGLTHYEIAELLCVSSGTVRTHLQNIYPKLGVCDKAAAVATALRHGLIE